MENEAEVNGSLTPVNIPGVPSAIGEIIVPNEDVTPIVGSQECSAETTMVKNDEDVDYDSSDEDIDDIEYDIEHPVWRRWLGSIIDENGVRKSTWTCRKPVITNVDFNNKRYENGDVVDGTIHMNIPEEEPGMTEGD